MTHFELSGWREIREGIFVARALPERVNLGLVIGSREALLVDTGSAPWQGDELRASIAELTTVPLTTVVVTHAHFDHAFGLSAFSDLDTIGHESVAGALRSDENMRAAAEFVLDLDDLAVPKRQLTVIGAKDLGDRWVEIGWFGAAHTAGDLAVVVPSERVLFAGDLVEQGDPPQVGPDSSIKNWHLALQSMLTVCRHDTMVVPGHGEIVDSAYVNWQRAGLAAVAGQVEWLVQQGVAEEQAYGHDQLQWPWDESWARRAIGYGYAEHSGIRRPLPWRSA